MICMHMSAFLLNEPVRMVELIVNASRSFQNAVYVFKKVTHTRTRNMLIYVCLYVVWASTVGIEKMFIKVVSIYVENYYTDEVHAFHTDSPMVPARPILRNWNNT